MIAWQSHCRDVRGIDVQGHVINVHFGDRQHRVEVNVASETLELVAVVARRAIVESLEDASLFAWTRNRNSGLVGFRIDQRGRLVGESAVPIAGLTPDEFLLYVRALAAACDLVEFQITGRDIK